MSVDITSWIWKYSPTKGSKRLVLLSLADNANDQGYCWPSIDSIAQRCRMTRRYIINILQELEAEGHIKIIHRFDNEKNVNKSNLYRVLTEKKQLLNEGGSEPQFTTPNELEDTRVVNPSSPPSEPQFTTPSEPQFTRVVNPSSPKPSFNRNLEPSVEAEEVPAAFPAAEIVQPDLPARSITQIVAAATGMVYIPPSESERIEQIQTLVDHYGPERVEDELRAAYTEWTGTRRKDNSRTYRGTNFGWVDWAQDRLAGNGSNEKPYAEMNNEERIAYLLNRSNDQEALHG